MRRKRQASRCNGCQDCHADGETAPIARFAPGRFWRTAGQVRRCTYFQLFRDVRFDDLEAALGGYPGVTFTMDRGITRGNEVEVWTTIFIPGTLLHGLGRVVGVVNGRTMMIDRIGEGTSLRVSQCDQAALFLL